MTKKLLFLLAVLAFAGCGWRSDQLQGERVKEERMTHVQCWSGGVVIYDDYTFDHVSTNRGTIFFSFKGNYHKVLTGDCLVEYNNW